MDLIVVSKDWCTIFNNSRIRALFEAKIFGDALLLGDGYPVRSYLMTPLRTTKTPAQELYNESLIRTHNIIERVFIDYVNMEKTVSSFGTGFSIFLKLKEY